jgi:hypothetical protein
MDTGSCKKSTHRVNNAGGDYVWTIKGNQPRTEWAIQIVARDEAKANLSLELRQSAVTSQPL